MLDSPFKRLIKLLPVISILLVAAPAFAWGPVGHAMIADMADAQLSPAADRQVQMLLATEGHTRLDEVASWADAIRNDQPETGHWHYVDIPLSASRYLATRDCPGQRCVVAAIDRFVATLEDSSASSAVRLRALKFLVHFIGDIHQPLHAADNDDRGGNDVSLRYFGRRTNLHQVWDSRILERALGLTLQPHFQFDVDAVDQAAHDLLSDTTAAERRRWATLPSGRDLSSAVTTWANESHRVAVTTAYGALPSRRQGNWASRYQTIAWRAERVQLRRAGIRLAAVLNRVLD